MENAIHMLNWATRTFFCLWIAIEVPAALGAAEARLDGNSFPSVCVTNLSDHSISELRIENQNGQQSLSVDRCEAKAYTMQNVMPFDAAEFVRISFTGADGHKHTAEFTHARDVRDHPTGLINVYVGFSDQIVAQAGGRSHVPDDRLGYIISTVMHEPQLIGTTARDPYFDTAEALIRYPVYDEIRFVRRGDFIGSGGTFFFRSKGRVVREIPPAEFMRVEDVGDGSIALVGPKGRFEVKPAADDAPLPGHPADPPPITIPFLDPAKRKAQEKESARIQAMFSGLASQQLGVSNWGRADVTHLRIAAHGQIYEWNGTIRAGGGAAHVGSVHEIEVDGTVQVTYSDGAGVQHAATFSNVPDVAGVWMPTREFYFGANYNVLIRTYYAVFRDNRWVVPDADGPSDKRLEKPELLGVVPVSNMTGTWRALIRYPRNDQIGEFDDGEMLGGDKYDYTSHETPEGDARYRIDLISENQVTLVRDGKRIVITMKDPAKP